MIDFNNDNLVKNLPDAFDKSEGSNNFKILENERVSINEHLSDLYDIYELIDLDNAKNKTLDRYGNRVGQARGLATDEQYLVMIKAKIMRTLGNGTYPSIINSICATFGCDPSEVYIAETDEPCTIKMITLPSTVLNSTGMTVKQTSKLIKSLLPICIRMDTLALEGTFEFANNENDYNELKGFCSIENGTLGGYLGYMSSDTNEPILPI